MKLFIIFVTLIAAAGVYGQTGKLVLKEDVPNILSDKPESLEISNEEWSELEAAVKSEDWTKSIALAEEFINRVQSEPGSEKLSRLRYIYLYALAGKVIAYSFSGEREQESVARMRLDDSAKKLVGFKFVFPVRKILANCAGVVNYICESKENPGFVRVAATNAEGTSIFFTEYVEMGKTKVDFRKTDRSDAILSGVLKGVRLNPERSNKLIMTLQFEDGNVEKIYPRN